MAKRTTTTNSKTRTRKPKRDVETTTTSEDSGSFQGKNFSGKFSKFSELFENPAVRYIASGIAAAALAKISKGLSTRYPELLNLVKGNLENWESKLAEFKQSQNSGSQEDAVH